MYVHLIAINLSVFVLCLLAWSKLWFYKRNKTHLLCLLIQTTVRLGEFWSRYKHSTFGLAFVRSALLLYLPMVYVVPHTQIKRDYKTKGSFRPTLSRTGPGCKFCAWSSFLESTVSVRVQVSAGGRFWVRVFGRPSTGGAAKCWEKWRSRSSGLQPSVTGCIDGFQSRDETAILENKTIANYGSCFAL